MGERGFSKGFDPRRSGGGKGHPSVKRELMTFLSVKPSDLWQTDDRGRLEVRPEHEPETHAEALALRLIALALEGNGLNAVAAIDRIMDRTDGKVPLPLQEKPQREPDVLTVHHVRRLPPPVE